LKKKICLTNRLFASTLTVAAEFDHLASSWMAEEVACFEQEFLAQCMTEEHLY
jgi:hypothetical protein